MEPHGWVDEYEHVIANRYAAAEDGLVIWIRDLDRVTMTSLKGRGGQLEFKRPCRIRCRRIGLRQGTAACMELELVLRQSVAARYVDDASCNTV